VRPGLLLLSFGAALVATAAVRFERKRRGNHFLKH
jgi:hypothetical protein